MVLRTMMSYCHDHPKVPTVGGFYKYPQKVHLHEYHLNSTQEQALANWVCIQDDKGIPSYLNLVRDKALAIIQQDQLKKALRKP